MSHVRVLPPRLTLAVVAAVAAALTAVSGSGTTAARADTPSTTGRAQQFGLAAGCCTPAGVTLGDQVAGYAATGAGWARLGFDWSSTESSPGTYTWSRDAVVSAFHSTGMKVLGVVAYSPRWAADPTCYQSYGSHCPPVDPATFASFVSALVERYDGDGIDDAPGSPRVDAWEIWNEPNLASFWRPTPSPTAYAALLRGAYDAVHAADSSATVVSAGLSPAGGTFAPTKFLASMYLAGAAGTFDALGFHPYSYPADPTKIASWNAWQQMFTAFPTVGLPDSLRSLMVTYGDGAKQIWATEYGAPTGGDTNGDGVSKCDSDGVVATGEDSCVTEARQATLLSDAYTQWRSYPWAGPLFWYSYQDLATGGLNIQNNFGLIRTDGSHKPAYDAYVAAVQAALPDTTAPTAPTGLRGTAGRTSVSLSWQPSSDDRGVTGYLVYRNGVKVTTTTGTSAVVGGLSRKTSYAFSVAARDAAGNVSPTSAPVTVRTS